MSGGLIDIEEGPEDPPFMVTAIQMSRRALPAINGECLHATATTDPPDQPVRWSIVGDTFGCQIHPVSGWLTAGDRPGILNIRATNGLEGAQFFDRQVYVIRVIIGDVQRGEGLPPSVPPDQTVDTPVTIEPDLAETDHSVHFDVINADALHGVADIFGNHIRKSSGSVALRGNVPQTEPGHSGYLRIRAKIDGTIFASVSRAFSVCAHPVAVENTNPQISVEAGWHGMVVALTVKSDSGTDAHLNRVVEWEEVSDSFDHTGSLVGSNIPGPQHVPVQAANRVEPDRHRSTLQSILDAHDKQPGGGAGSWSVNQLDVFVCLRCGMCGPRVIPRSGYRIKRTILSGPGQQVRLQVRKTRHTVKLKGFKAQAGPSNNIPVIVAPVRNP